MPIALALLADTEHGLLGRGLRTGVNHGRACASQVGASCHRDRDRWSRAGLHDSARWSAAHRLANRSLGDQTPWLASSRYAHDTRGYVIDNPWTISSGRGWIGVASGMPKFWKKPGAACYARACRFAYVVLSRDEVARIMKHLDGVRWVMVVPVVRRRIAAAGMPGAPRERHRAGPAADCDPTRKRSEGPAHHITDWCHRAAGSPSRVSQTATRARSGAKVRACGAAVRARSQISERPYRVGLAVRVSGVSGVYRSKMGTTQRAFIFTNRWSRRRWRTPHGRPGCS
jgi:hypothetical protein